MGPAALCHRRRAVGLSTGGRRTAGRIGNTGGPVPGVIRSRDWMSASVPRRSNVGTTPPGRRLIRWRCLRNQVRQDIGRFPSFSAAAAEALRSSTRASGWNAQLLTTICVCSWRQAGIDSCPSYPSVLRYLKFIGLLRRQSPRAAASGPGTLSRCRNVRSAATKSSMSSVDAPRLPHGSRKVLTARAGGSNPCGQLHR